MYPVLYAQMINWVAQIGAVSKYCPFSQPQSTLGDMLLTHPVTATTGSNRKTPVASLCQGPFYCLNGAPQTLSLLHWFRSWDIRGTRFGFLCEK